MLVVDLGLVCTLLELLPLDIFGRPLDESEGFGNPPRKGSLIPLEREDAILLVISSRSLCSSSVEIKTWVHAKFSPPQI